ncbi:MAG: glycosyltransferase, partial [Bacteroidota bacterium]|nr:glycosyltransferase [Bacteroidota bacterium]
LELFKILPSFAIGLTQNFSEHRKKKLSFLKRKSFLGDYLFNRGVYTAEETASILNTSATYVNKTIDEIDLSFLTSNGKTDGRNVISLGEQNIYMQSQLLKDTDYMGMWHGLEVRVPFLDKELMETVHSIAPEIKFNSKLKKHLLIKAFDDVLPSQIYDRKKQGFTFPFENWIIPVQTTSRRSTGFVKKLAKLKFGKIQWVHYWAYLLTCHNGSIKYYDKQVKKVLFLNLSAFRFTGGIEKFNRAFLKALSEFEADGKLVSDVYSAYDTDSDKRYFQNEHYNGFKGNRIKFVFAVWRDAKKYDTIILGHINLSLTAWGIKKMFPGKRLILITHGIEVWNTVSGVKKFVIQNADQIFSVSAYTKETLTRVHKISGEKVAIFHNTIDPFFSYPVTFDKPQYLIDRYKINADVSIIFTLTRLSASEKYKGYDKVIEVLPYLKNCVSDPKYIISGKADNTEYDRLTQLRKQNNLSENVVLTGFIKDEEVVDHFLLADVFIMPSRKEGFGIVFIEAMACGLPVIAGNKDGSADALQNGVLGQLIDPDSDAEMFQAMVNTLQDRARLEDVCVKKELQQKVKAAFGFDTYKRNLEKLLV